MTACDDVLPELFGYHLGASEPERRASIDAHLVSCSSCLRAYLEHKRVTEDGAAFEARPSPRVRERLRAEVRRRKPTRFAPWVALAAAASLAVAGVWWAMQPSAPALRTLPNDLVDAPVAPASASLF